MQQPENRSRVLIQALPCYCNTDSISRLPIGLPNPGKNMAKKRKWRRERKYGKERDGVYIAMLGFKIGIIIISGASPHPCTDGRYLAQSAKFHIGYMYKGWMQCVRGANFGLKMTKRNARNQFSFNGCPIYRPNTASAILLLNLH